MEQLSVETVVATRSGISSGDKIEQNDKAMKALLDKQMRDRSFKEAMRTCFSLVPNDDVFRKLLARLDEAEKKQR
ncbi:hypothetical protein [Phyllobacterium ifriqiyense]|uniref:hypothetical protein n=1 Tax=Phyllobacterium ifriqiyense TaxID=314238 RepID=UPI003395B56B